jgi:hypothetical protein
MNHSFKIFIDLPVVEQQALQEADYSGMKLWSNGYLNGTTDFYGLSTQVEDITISQIRKEKKLRMRELEQKLKDHDYFYVYANGRAYDKGKQSEEEIENMVAEIDGMDGRKDAIKLYRKYLKKNESVGETKKDKVDLNISVSGSGASLKKFLSLEECVKDVADKHKKETTKNINLGYGEERPIGGKSKHGFVDVGNLYEGHIKWVAPSKERTKKI